MLLIIAAGVKTVAVSGCGTSSCRTNGIDVALGGDDGKGRSGGDSDCCEMVLVGSLYKCNDAGTSVMVPVLVMMMIMLVILVREMATWRHCWPSVVAEILQRIEFTRWHF